jgi:hypothetical protein
MFLHAVSCSSEYCATPDDYIVNGVPVLFFKTYVGAAAKVCMCVCTLMYYLLLYYDVCTASVDCRASTTAK